MPCQERHQARGCCPEPGDPGEGLAVVAKAIRVGFVEGLDEPFWGREDPWRVRALTRYVAPHAISRTNAHGPVLSAPGSAHNGLCHGWTNDPLAGLGRGLQVPGECRLLTASLKISRISSA